MLFFFDFFYWEMMGYGSEFGMDQYELLVEVMVKFRGWVILIINDYFVMWVLFDCFICVSVLICYIVGGGMGVVWSEFIYIIQLGIGFGWVLCFVYVVGLNFCRN